MAEKLYNWICENIGEITPETRDHVLERIKGYPLEKIAEEAGVSISYAGHMLKMIRKDPQPGQKIALRIVYESDGKSSIEMYNRLGNKQSCISLPFLQYLGIVTRLGSSYRNYPIKVNKSRMKEYWPDIEDWNSERATGHILGKRIKEALTILGLKSLSELKPEHEKNVEELSKIDWKLRGWDAPSAVNKIKRRLLRSIKSKT